MSTKRQLAKRLWLLALACLSIPVFYVLSLGPAAFAYHKFDLQAHWLGKAFAVFYSPLEDYLKNNSTEYPAKLLERYVELWIDVD